MANLVSFDDVTEAPVSGLFELSSHDAHVCSVLFCLQRCDLVMLKETFSRIDAEQE